MKLFILFFIIFNVTCSDIIAPAYGIELNSLYNKAEVVACVTIIGSEIFSDTTFSDVEYVISKNHECTAIVIKQYKGLRLSDTIKMNISAYSFPKQVNEGSDFFIFGDVFTTKIFCTELLPYNKKHHKSLLKLQSKNKK